MSRFSAFSRCLPLVNPDTNPPPPPPPPPPPETFVKKFNFGYYWAALYGGGGPGGISDYAGIKTDLANIANLNGVLIRCTWKELEPSEGVYDWSIINTVYNDVSTLATPKRVCVLLELRSTSSGGTAPAHVPNYVINNPGTYGGAAGNGGTWFSTGGAAANPLDIRYMRLWNTALLNRLKALSDAFAAQFDNKPYFEMLQFSEPIVATKNADAANAGIPADYQTTYPDGIKNWVIYTNTKFVKTIVTQLCNFPQTLNTTYIPSLRDNGIGVSCPNSLKDEPGLWSNDSRGLGIWRWLSRTDAAKLQGVTVIAPHIQKPECYYSNLSGNDAPDPDTGAPGFDGLGRKPGDTPYDPRFGANGAEEICDLLKSVGANYAFVTRAPQEPITGSFGRNSQDAIDIPAWQAYFQRPLAQIQLNGTRPSNLP